MSLAVRRSRLLLCLCLACALVWPAPPARGDWPQFRGPNSSGIAIGPAPPSEFGPGKNELWRLPLASGHSSPCVAGDSIFLTTYEPRRRTLSVVCIDRVGGAIRWQREVPAKTIEKGHPSFNPASSSPASDGERVVAYFGSFGLICFDIAGKKLWEIEMPLARSFGGNATSPAIFGDRVILYRGTYGDHFLLAADKTTGEELWRVPQYERITGEMACTACPIISGNELIVHGARSVQAFDIATGKRLWITKCATTATSTPVLAGNEVIVAAWNKMGEPALRPPFPSFEELAGEHDRDGDGTISRDELPKLWIFHRPLGAEAPLNGGTVSFERADRNGDGEITAGEWSARVRELESFRARYRTHGILAIRLDSKGVVEANEIRTLATTGIPEVPSPLCDGDLVYFVKNGGVLTCVDLRSGKRVYRMRTGGRGTHYASPIIAGGKLFTIAGNGRITVLTAGRDPEILATNDMGDSVFATPAVAGGTIYVRTHHTLFAFGEMKGRGGGD